MKKGLFFGTANSVMRKPPGFVLVFFLFLTALFADVQEPKTGISFPETTEFSGKKLMLSGMGVRSKMMVKVYAGALYLDPSVKEDLASYKAQVSNPDQRVYDAIITGAFAKLFELHFVRDVEGSKIVEAYREALKKSIDIRSADISADVKKFLDANNVDMKKDERIRIAIQDDDVTVTQPSGNPASIQNKKLAAAVTAIWLGKNPISEDLKKGMVSLLPSLL